MEGHGKMQTFLTNSPTIECDMCGNYKAEEMDVWEDLETCKRYFICKECASPQGSELIGSIKPNDT